ncbi:MAG: hypothetical protein QW424_05155, partial [Candidatus Bathyarchaeia archaeon]
MASPIESEIMNYLKSILGADLIEVYRQRERRIFANVKSEAVRRAIEALKNKYGDMRFMTLSAVDAGLDIEYLYHF